MQEDIHAIALGQQVIKSDVVGALGSDDLEVWWPGEHDATTNDVFEINKEKRGWHYGFTSTRCANEWHAFAIYIFEDIGNFFVLKEMKRSEGFQIFSQRRAKQHSGTSKSTRRANTSDAAQTSSTPKQATKRLKLDRKSAITLLPANVQVAVSRTESDWGFGPGDRSAVTVAAISCYPSIPSPDQTTDSSDGAEEIDRHTTGQNTENATQNMYSVMHSANALFQHHQHHQDQQQLLHVQHLQQERSRLMARYKASLKVQQQLHAQIPSGVSPPPQAILPPLAALTPNSSSSIATVRHNHQRLALGFTTSEIAPSIARPPSNVTVPIRTVPKDKHVGVQNYTKVKKSSDDVAAESKPGVQRQHVRQYDQQKLAYALLGLAAPETATVATSLPAREIIKAL